MPIVKANIACEDTELGGIYSRLHALNEDESGWLCYEVATATTDQAIPISFSTGIAAVDVLFITSTYAITYALNGSATATTLDANGFHLYFGTNVTSMTVSNASGSTAVIKIYVAGT